jgi:hypothetical protein
MLVSILALGSQPTSCVHLEFPVGNTSLVVDILSHLERIPAPAGAARAKSSTILGYTSYLKKIEE